MEKHQNTVRIWPKSIHEARPDHFERYRFASEIITPGSSVIDAACGVGYGSHMLTKKGLIVSGYDISPDAIAHARNHFSTDNLSFFCDDLMNLTSEADCLISIETIEHLNNPEKFLSQVKTKNIIASVPNQELYPFVAENFANDEYPHLRHYTPLEFEDLFRNIGFSVTGKFCQKDKRPGNIFEGTDGIFLIFLAQKND